VHTVSFMTERGELKDSNTLACSLKFQRSVPALPRSPGKLLLDTPSIKTLQELHSFFTALSVYSPSVTVADPGQSKSVSLNELEAVIERDFLEKLPIR